jgi:hypothetical protein
MNNEQARFLLRAYRPGGHDAGDAAFSEALQQARADPVLGAWFASQQSFDAAVAAKLQAVAPQPGLREAILTGARVSKAAPRGWWRPAGWMAMAASLAVIVSVVAIHWLQRTGPGPAGLAQMASFALADAETAHAGPHAGHLGALGAWLQNPANRISTGAPVDLAQLKAQGCRAVKIAGHEVFEICFNRNGGWYHLYLARRGDFEVEEGAGGPVFREQDQRSTVAWTDRERAYVLMARGGADALRRIL